MSNETYKRVAPHIQRVSYDGGVAPNITPELLALMKSNFQFEQEGTLKLFYCPEH